MERPRRKNCACRDMITASKELGRNIWQRSYYDHVVRDESDYLRIASYIMENPAKWMEDRYYVPEQ